MLEKRLRKTELDKLASRDIELKFVPSNPKWLKVRMAASRTNSLFRIRLGGRKPTLAMEVCVFKMSTLLD